MNRRIRLSMLLVAGTLLASGTAHAGFIFMKNGYIIQGRIIEKDPEKIVLRWSDGTMTIENRFIMDVVLDGSEEADLRALAELTAAASQVAPVEPEYVEPSVPLHLPDNITDIIPLHGDDFGTDDPTPTVVDVHPMSTDPAGLNGGTEEPSVSTVPMERVFAGLGCALMPAAGWDVVEDDGYVRVSKSGTGAPASFTVHRHPGCPLSVEDASKELRGLMSESYPGLKGIVETTHSMTGASAMRMDGTYPASSLVFSQVLVKADQSCYLIGMSHGLPVDSGDRQNLEAMLQSFRVLDQ